MKYCVQCGRAMSANDEHRCCQSCRPNKVKASGYRATKSQRIEYNERRRQRRALLRDRALLKTWDQHVRTRG